MKALPLARVGTADSCDGHGLGASSIGFLTRWDAAWAEAALAYFLPRDRSSIWKFDCEHRRLSISTSGDYSDAAVLGLFQDIQLVARALMAQGDWTRNQLALARRDAISCSKQVPPSTEEFSRAASIALHQRFRSPRGAPRLKSSTHTAEEKKELPNARVLLGRFASPNVERRRDAAGVVMPRILLALDLIRDRDSVDFGNTPLHAVADAIFRDLVDQAHPARGPLAPFLLDRIRGRLLSTARTPSPAGGTYRSFSKAQLEIALHADPIRRIFDIRDWLEYRPRPEPLPAPAELKAEEIAPARLQKLLASKVHGDRERGLGLAKSLLLRLANEAASEDLYFASGTYDASDVLARIEKALLRRPLVVKGTKHHKKSDIKKYLSAVLRRRILRQKVQPLLASVNPRVRASGLALARPLLRRFAMAVAEEAQLGNAGSYDVEEIVHEFAETVLKRPFVANKGFEAYLYTALANRLQTMFERRTINAPPKWRAPRGTTRMGEKRPPALPELVNLDLLERTRGEMPPAYATDLLAFRYWRDAKTIFAAALRAVHKSEQEKKDLIDSDRNTLEAMLKRYSRTATIKELASKSGVSENAIEKQHSRLRQKLLAGVELRRASGALDEQEFTFQLRMIKRTLKGPGMGEDLERGR